MAIELISTVVPKNNGSFPIVLSNDLKGGIHYVDSLEAMNAISPQRLQIGMLCYVGGKVNKYYHYIDTGWKVFTAGGGTDISDNEALQRIFRVDTVEEMNGLSLYGVNTGNVCFVKADNSAYIYTEEGWTNFTAFHNRIHIGAEPPIDRTMIWIDTSDDVVYEHTLIDNLVINEIRETVAALRRDVDVIIAAIKNGGDIEWPDGGGGGGTEDLYINRLVLENDSDFFVTETGEYIVDEDSKTGNSGGTEPTPPPTPTFSYAITTENEDIITAENGDIIVQEMQQ